MREQCAPPAPLGLKKDSLKKHILFVHEGIKYPCNQWYYKARYKNHLKTHKGAIHEGVKYLCEECNYKGTQKTSHKNSLPQSVKYPCNECYFNIWIFHLSHSQHNESFIRFFTLNPVEHSNLVATWFSNRNNKNMFKIFHFIFLI